MQGKAVGFISVTNQVNLSLLWDHYQLEPYHGLRKPSPDDVITSTATAKLSSSSSSHSSSLSGNSSVHSKPATPLPQAEKS